MYCKYKSFIGVSDIPYYYEKRDRDSIIQPHPEVQFESYKSYEKFMRSLCEVYVKFMYHIINLKKKG